MKRLLLFTTAALAVGPLTAKQPAPAALQPAAKTAAAPAPAPGLPKSTAPVVNPATIKPSTFKTDKERNGYAVGMNVGAGLAANWKRQGLPVDMLDLDTFARAMKDALAGSKPAMDEAESRDTLQRLQQAVTERKTEAATKNKSDGEKFLAENKTKPGVVTLPSGLQYKIVSNGQGESPKADDTVTVNYRGTLIDGTEFDSSFKRGQPASFRVNGVIKGWTEALQLMKPGAKWNLFIPSDLAYGEKSPPMIPPNSVLQFEVELISIAPPPPAQPAAQPITSDIIRVPSAEEMKHGAKIETIKADEISKYTNSGAKK